MPTCQSAYHWHKQIKIYTEKYDLHCVNPHPLEVIHERFGSCSYCVFVWRFASNTSLWSLISYTHKIL
jgi:hypothetical protein